MNHTSAVRKKKIRRKRQRAIRRAVYLAGLMAVIVFAIRAMTHYLLVDNILDRKEDEHVQAVSVSATAAAPAAVSMTVKTPIERTSSQIYEDLAEYAETSEDASEIYENRNAYPEIMLAAYLNNPEMEQFISGYLNQDEISLDRGLTNEEKQQKFPLLIQWDQRWGYVPYGGSIIGLSGCGPTCLSMVLISLTGNTEQTPDEIARFSEENGYYVEGSGTAWALMTEGASKLGLYARELSLDEQVMRAELDAGHPIICSMGTGDFTLEGHFVLIYDYNEEGFWINDPNCIVRSSQAWTFDRLRGQIKNLWSYAKP